MNKTFLMLIADEIQSTLVVGATDFYTLICSIFHTLCVSLVCSYHKRHVPFNQAKTTRLTKQSNCESRYRNTHTHTHTRRMDTVIVSLCNFHVALPSAVQSVWHGIARAINQRKAVTMLESENKNKRNKEFVGAYERWDESAVVAITLHLLDGEGDRGCLSIGVRW